MSFILLGILNSQAAAAGGGSDYELIETTVLTSSATDVYFSSIPQTYKHLQVRMTVRTTFSGTTAIRVRPNSDSGFNYYTHRLRGYGSGVNSSNASDTGRIDDILVNSGNASNIFGAGILDLLDYANSNKYKTFRSLHGQYSNSTVVSLSSIQWRNTSAVTDLQLNGWDGSFATGSRFSLYGIKG